MSDLKVQIILEALDHATKNISGVHDRVVELKNVLTTSEFTQAANGMDRLGQSVKDSTQPMADAAKTAISLGGAISVLASALAGRVYQSAVEYESATANLAKVMDGGAESAARYGDKLNALASQYGQNGQALLEGMTNFVQAGYSADEAFGLVEQSVKMMIAGEMQAGESSAALVSILKGFGAPASDAAHAVDLLNAVSNKYATDVQQLSEGMAALSPIARQMGFSMDETAGLLTPVIEVFRSGNEAADALKTGLQRLTDDSKPVTEALAQIGVSQRNANGELRSGREIFLDVANAFGSLGAAQKQYLTQQLVGIDQAGRMSIVLGNMSGFLEVAATATNSAGSALKEVEVRLGTAQVKGQQAEEAFRQLSVTLGNQFKPQITGLISATGELAGAFDAAVKAGDLNPLLNALRPQITAVESLVQAMAANLETALAGVDWRPLADGLKSVSTELGEAFGILTEGVDLTTVEGLRTVLNGVVQILGSLAQWISGVIDGLGPLMSALNSLFGLVSSGAPQFAHLLGQLEGLALSANTVIPVITNLGSTIFGVLGTIAEFAFKVTLAVAALRLLAGAGLPIGPIFASITSALTAIGPVLVSAIARFTGLSAVLKSVSAVAVTVGAYELGKWLREVALDAGYSAEQGTLAAKAFDLLATEAEKAQRHLSEIDEKVAAKLKQISDQTKIAFASMAAFNRAVADGVIAWNPLTKAWEKAAAKAADFTAANRRLIESNERQSAVADALQQHFASLGLVYDKVTGKVSKQGEEIKKNADQIGQETEARVTHLRLLQLEAEARGDTVTAARLEAQIRLVSIAGLQQQLSVKEQELAQARQAVVDKLAEADADGIRTQTELLGIETVNAAVTAKEAELVKIREAIALKQKEAGKQQEVGASAAASADQASQANIVLTASTQGVGMAMSQTYYETNTLTGGLTKVTKQTKALGDGAQAAQKWMTMMLDEAKASIGEYSKEAQAAIDALLSGTHSLEENLHNLEKLDAAQFVNTDSLTKAKAELGKLEEALKATADKAEAFRKAGTDASNIFAGMDQQLAAVYRFQERLIAAQLAAQKLAVATEEMGQRLDALKSRFDSGDLSLAEYIQKLERAQRAYAYLGDERLDGLRSALADARRQMEDFTSSAQDGLRSLQIEWAQLNDQQAEVLRLEYLESQMKIQQALAEAKAAGNKEAIKSLQEQLRLLEAIYQKRQADLKAEEEAAKRQAEADAAAQVQDQQNQTVKTVKIDMTTSDGNAASINVLPGQETVFEQFLKELANAKKTAA